MNQARKAGSGSDGRTLKMADVAKLLGVSVATVSRALTKPEQVRPDLRERVLKGVAEIGYMPNTAARNLRARKSMMVLVVVPNIANPFFPEVVRGIDDELGRNGYGLIIGNLDQQPEKYARFLDIVQSGQVDGVMLLNGHIPVHQGRGLLDFDVPVVAMCAAIDAPIPHVLVENALASKVAVRHLADLGHRRIAYLSGPAGNVVEIERYDGFRVGVVAAGLDLGEQVYWPGDYSLASGVAAAKRFLAGERKVTAVYATSDEMAIGFVKTMHTAGVRVPQDLSVVGFDGVDYADFCEPTLTTLVQPRHEIGRLAAQRLLEALSGKRSRKLHIERLPVRLLARDSTAAVRAITQEAGGRI
ncbi:LacI family DNA-binding transcriptional regulator [Lacibacterium aquatile]|uniref:LacI family DNA-binding transcriptional regulator n=1 Tax=Lacibacterium aquatile TaxID=1168082 RepID=A0ABW5DS94_9PROT